MVSFSSYGSLNLALIKEKKLSKLIFDNVFRNLIFV